MGGGASKEVGERKLASGSKGIAEEHQRQVQDRVTIHEVVQW
jgi:hypothetical protein